MRSLHIVLHILPMYFNNLNPWQHTSFTIILLHTFLRFHRLLYRSLLPLYVHSILTTVQVPIKSRFCLHFSVTNIIAEIVISYIRNFMNSTLPTNARYIFSFHNNIYKAVRFIIICTLLIVL